ncbi:MAG TPA: MoaD/ThiS family protein [Clostridia bacterium]|nr:MoaD/ThiS family protein [Clostridia bacterium]
MIEIRLFAHFRNGREKISFQPVEDFPTPAHILKHLEIEQKKVAILLVNGFHSKFDHPLKEGDIVAIFPPVAGG